MTISSHTEAPVGPVHEIPGDAGKKGPRPGIALCLSGGGYRAMLFHLGSLWRLNEAGLLRKLDRVSSVSGGSITAGVLGMNWSSLGFDEACVARAFDQQVVAPVRRLAGKTLDRGAIIGGGLLPGTISDRVNRGYARYLFGDRTLQDLPADGNGPRFVINATNVQSGVLWRFSRPLMGDWRVGLIRDPDLPLSLAVTASSAFPPVLSPMVLDLDPDRYEVASGHDLTSDAYRDEVVLTDGGVYDNLGLETAWKRYMTILVSDGGGRFEPDATPHRDWIRHSTGILSIIDGQVRSLRKRQVVGSFAAGERTGAYWGIWTDSAEYDVADRVSAPSEKTLRLAAIPTRLKALDRVVQEQLINWGYASCDGSIRAYYDPKIPRGELPYAASGLG